MWDSGWSGSNKMHQGLFADFYSVFPVLSCCSYPCSLGNRLHCKLFSKQAKLIYKLIKTYGNGFSELFFNNDTGYWKKNHALHRGPQKHWRSEQLEDYRECICQRQAYLKIQPWFQTSAERTTVSLRIATTIFLPEGERKPIFRPPGNKKEPTGSVGEGGTLGAFLSHLIIPRVWGREGGHFCDALFPPQVWINAFQVPLYKFFEDPQNQEEGNEDNGHARD